ncbi:MAG TPA: hypothetical protein VI818_06020 [Candidatus Thermoplasmatota archaeon]|nr:hypothetical protein [Candidatus Thermoplasmatota archaeon]
MILRSGIPLFIVGTLLLGLLVVPIGSAHVTACAPADFTDPPADFQRGAGTTSQIDGQTGANKADLTNGCLVETDEALEVWVGTAATPASAANQIQRYTLSLTIGGAAKQIVFTCSGGTACAATGAGAAKISGQGVEFTITRAAVGPTGTEIKGVRIVSYAEFVNPTGGVLTASDAVPNDAAGHFATAPYVFGSRAPPTFDSDGDGAADRYELENGTNPVSLDSDFDRLLDGDSVEVETSSQAFTNFTDARILKLADDGTLAVFAGEKHFGTNATNADTDGDGLLDGPNVTAAVGSNASMYFANHTISPSNAGEDPEIYPGEVAFNANPTATDTDNDGVSDYDEVTGTGNPFQNGSHFPGFPGSTNPAAADTDGDGLDDLGERTAGTSPYESDSDLDGIADGSEVQAGTNPTNPDSDADGTTDGDEARLGTDPLDPNSKPVTETDAGGAEVGYILFSTIALLAVILLCVVGILVRWG